MFYIQDPTFENSKQLLDVILECALRASSGAGAYAFVSADGVNLLMGDPAFKAFLQRGEFFLVIGMDEITNTHTLETLNGYMRMYPNLQVRAFLHDTTGSTFHPKFCWFECEDGGYVITGSGNLTQKGMQRNREAFFIKNLAPNELSEIKRIWEAWIMSASIFLLPLTDEAVVSRAEENIRRIQAIRPRHRVTGRRSVAGQSAQQLQAQDLPDVSEVYANDEIGAWEYDLDAPVLIAEIPKGQGRWSQANFDADTFRTYFESTPGVLGQLAIVLRDVDADGNLGEIRHRPPVSVASHNYRVELFVKSGTAYPEVGRVLGVFVKIASRTFLYTLLFPGEEGHSALQQMLNKHRVRDDRLVRYQTTVQELMNATPGLSILRYLSQVD